MTTWVNQKQCPNHTEDFSCRNYCVQDFLIRYNPPIKRIYHPIRPPSSFEYFIRYAPCLTNTTSVTTPCHTNTSSDTTPPCYTNTLSDTTPCRANTSSIPLSYEYFIRYDPPVMQTLHPTPGHTNTSSDTTPSIVQILLPIPRRTNTSCVFLITGDIKIGRHEIF